MFPGWVTHPLNCGSHVIAWMANVNILQQTVPPGSHHTQKSLRNLCSNRSPWIYSGQGTAVWWSTGASARLLFTPVQTTPSISSRPTGLHSKPSLHFLSCSLPVCDTQNPCIVAFGVCVCFISIALRYKILIIITYIKSTYIDFVIQGILFATTTKMSLAEWHLSPH